MAKFIKAISWMIVALYASLVASFVDAAFNLVFLGWSNTSLENLGYWQLFWLNMAVALTVSTGAALANCSMAFNNKDYETLAETGSKFDTLLD